MTEEQELINTLNDGLAIALPEKTSMHDFEDYLSAYITECIQTIPSAIGFQKLVSLLYRVDIPEQKLRVVLEENPGEDASRIITRLIIERQMEKIKTRRQFRKPDSDIDENEKW